MMTNKLFLILGALLAPAVAQVSCNLRPDYTGPVLSNGWSAQLVYDDLDDPRSILFDSNGNMLVVQQGHGIVHLTFNDGGGTCLSVVRETVVVNNNDVRPRPLSQSDANRNSFFMDWLSQ